MESQNIEYKAKWQDEYLKWICGFANAQGGTLYIGIDDEGNVCGVKNAHKLSEDIPNKIVTLLGIVADVNLLTKDGKDYIEINVAPSNVPISLKGVYHYRSGSTKQELGGIALQQFVLKKLGRTWDDIICEQATFGDIDRKAIEYFLRKAVDAQRLPEDSLNETTENVLRNLNLVDADGKLKNAAILLFGKNPQRFITGVEFKIGYFGADESDLVFQDLIEGNIIQMCDTVVKTLKAKYLISPIHYEGLQRIEPLEIPESALREAIFNSIIHKDYMGVSIQMKVYRDRIQLWNDGTLPEDFTIEKLLGPHESKPRNKNIAAAFYRAGFIESWGRGINKIRKGFQDAGLPEPKYETSMGGVRVTIYRNTAINPNNYPVSGNNYPVNESDATQETTKKTAERIILAIKKNPYITREELAEQLSITVKGVDWQIKALKSKGYLFRVGADKNGYWQIKTTF